MPRFDPETEYSTRDLLLALGLPQDARGGAWFQGYHRYGSEFYVFATVRKSARPEGDRRDHWEGDLLRWSAKQGSWRGDREIEGLVSGRFKVHVLWRREGNPRFIYRGQAVADEISDTSPVTVLWDFRGAPPPAAQFAGWPTSDGRSGG